jgi:hypothetical protein
VLADHLKKYNILVEYKPPHWVHWDALEKVGGYILANVCSCGAYQGWSELIKGFELDEPFVIGGQYGEDVEIYPRAP